MMADNDSQINASAFFNTYKVSLTREQQKALAMLLPASHSFQPFKLTRSIDQQSLRSEPKIHKKKPHPPSTKEQKDPDYSASYLPAPKDPPPAPKVESTPGIPGGQAFMQCYLILKKLKKSVFAWPFKVPVDPKALRIPDYFNVVIEPMDLKTIEQNLRKEAYKHPAEFHRDIYKILMNSYKFNQKNSEVFSTTSEFQEEYLRIVKDAKDGKLLPPIEMKSKQEDSVAVESQFAPNNSYFQEQKPSVPPKQVRHYNKKDKPQKQPEQKSLEKLIVPPKEKQPQKIEFDPPSIHQEAKQQQQNIKNQFIDPFLSFFPVHEVPIPPKNEVIVAAEIHDSKLEKNQKQIKQEVKKETEEQEMSASMEQLKKMKSKVLQKKHKEKKPKKIEALQSPSEIKELKQTTQAENQKTVVINQIQKRLTDILKRLNQYQIPNKVKVKPTQKNTQNYEHPNFNNFTTITPSEKKKLAEKLLVLPSQDHEYVLEICFRNKRCHQKFHKNEYQIDLDKLDGKVLKQLSNFVAMRIKKMKREVNRNKEEFKKQQQEEDQEEEEDEDEVEQEEENEPDQDDDQDYQNESNNSPNYERDERDQRDDHFHQPSGNFYQNFLQDNRQAPDFRSRNFVPMFEMIDSDDGRHRRHHPGDEYSNQFHFQ